MQASQGAIAFFCFVFLAQAPLIYADIFGFWQGAVFATIGLNLLAVIVAGLMAKEASKFTRELSWTLVGLFCSIIFFPGFVRAHKQSHWSQCKKQVSQAGTSLQKLLPEQGKLPNSLSELDGITGCPVGGLDVYRENYRPDNSERILFCPLHQEVRPKPEYPKLVLERSGGEQEQQILYLESPEDLKNVEPVSD